MAKLVPGHPPGFEGSFQRQKSALEALNAKSLTLPEGEIVGTMLQFQAYDGYAHYLVVGESAHGIEIQHVPYIGGYEIPAAHIRGLEREDVVEQQQRAKALAAMFAKQARRAPRP